MFGKILNFFTHNKNGILLDLFCERTFFWNPLNTNSDYHHTKTWLGFIHSSLHNNDTYDYKPENLKYLLENVQFKKSLQYCIGLFVLSPENKIVLESYIKTISLNIPIFCIKHPCEINNSIFN
jgi:hypothetical protein